MKSKKTYSRKGDKSETSPLPWKTAMNLLKLLEADKDFNNLLLLASGFYLGLRIGDILNLTWEQLLTPVDETFTVLEGKTGKARTMQIHPELSRMVNKVFKIENPLPGDFVFVNQKPGRDTSKPIGVHAANYRLKSVFEKYDISAENASSHTLRKTFGRRVYENNGKSEDALILLSQLFSHRDISTTRRYIGLTKERMLNAYLSL